MKIYIIAGEASGDIYGAKLIEAIKKIAPEAQFSGIGGDKMTATGLTSLFPMSEISIMGFLEVIPHIPNTLRRIRQTVEDIKNIRPDVVVTIDSPGFCCRVVENLKKGAKKGLIQSIIRSASVMRAERTLPYVSTQDTVHDDIIRRSQPFFLHYVAPTVWAYKPKRAEKFARLFNHLLAILPFEPPYFEKVGLPCTYIGHPITENIPQTHETAFRQKYNISPGDTLICLMPGSRIGEVLRLLPTFLEATKLLAYAPNLKLVIPTIPATAPLVGKIVELSGVNAIIVQDDAEKHSAYKISNAAIVKSGTGTLEVSIAGCPMVIAYKINIISYVMIKMMLKVKYANLINIILNKELIPELIQGDCTPYLIAQQVDLLLNSTAKREQQISESKAVLEQLGQGQSITPSDKAAQTVLALIGK